MLSRTRGSLDMNEDDGPDPCVSEPMPWVVLADVAVAPADEMSVKPN
jgi:hypothetical protein